jgi:hypothetical protein
MVGGGALVVWALTAWLPLEGRLGENENAMFADIRSLSLLL